MSQRKSPKAKPTPTPKPSRYRYQGMGFLRDISRAVDEAMSRMGKAASKVTRKMGGGE